MKSELTQRIEALLADEQDIITIYSTVACEIFHYFDGLNWAGFYRNVDGVLKVGPYQGTHGCLTITFDRGVCGKCATERTVQVVDDVDALPYHIACSSETRSEICYPILNANGEVLSILDIDSVVPSRFDTETQEELDQVVALLNKKLATL